MAGWLLVLFVVSVIFGVTLSWVESHRQKSRPRVETFTGGLSQRVGDIRLPRTRGDRPAQPCFRLGAPAVTPHTRG